MADIEYKNDGLHVNSALELQGVRQENIDNPEFIQVTIDSEEKIIEAIKKDGTKQIESLTFNKITGKEVNTKILKLNDKTLTEHDINALSSVDELYSAYLRNGKYGEATTPITAEMFNNPSELINTLNEAFENYAILCKCTIKGFYPFYTSDLSNGRFTFKINHNFRESVITEDMSYEQMASFINYQFTVPINRFNDAILNTTNNVHASINTGIRVGEPSAIVSDDLSTLYIYSSSLTRHKSLDGVHYELDHQLTINGETVTQSNPDYLMHVNINYINGKYYLIGTHNNYNPLVLWVSDDGWNFTKVGTLLEIGDIINSSNDTIGNFGNSYLHYELGTELWYLYYEITRPGGKGWEICVASCSDIFEERESGKFGVWTQNNDNPIFKAELDPYTSRTSSAGNPNLACGSNNLPIKYNGKYYMYYHGGDSWTGSALFRAYSENLWDWTSEGVLYNNRDNPSEGEYWPGNADQCIIEFKGRTLLFYTWDINSYPRPEYVKLTIDDRPLHEILSLMP